MRNPYCLKKIYRLRITNYMGTRKFYLFILN